MQKWFEEVVKEVDLDCLNKAKKHQALLTKPLGSLGELEIIAAQFAGWQSKLRPQLARVQITIFAGDHGVFSQGVSAFPQEVTVQMIMNFLNGGAAISVLSRELSAGFSVINMGTVSSLPNDYLDHSHLINVNIAPGTADFSLEPAMTLPQLEDAMTVGRSCVASTGPDLFIGGEMGIGNTSSASAIYAALLNLSPDQVVGRGTGIDNDGLNRKKTAVSKALELHKSILSDPYQVLRCLGGLEIAGLVGSYISCAQKGIPVLVDGFICTAAAIVATRLNPGVRDWLLFSHESAEPAHAKALEYLGAKPLLKLGLRLGEGSGAALAVPLLKSALALHNGMATFEQAQVNGS